MTEVCEVVKSFMVVANDKVRLRSVSTKTLVVELNICSIASI